MAIRLLYSALHSGQTTIDVAVLGEGRKVAPEAWILIWYCVTTTNPACMWWDGATEKFMVNSEAECGSYAKKIATKVHASFHFDLEYICRKGVPPEPYRP
jgi:hypothetical protein